MQGVHKTQGIMLLLNDLNAEKFVHLSVLMFFLVTYNVKATSPQDAVLYQTKQPTSRPGAMRSNKKRDITKTTYSHNSYRGRPSSHVSTSAGHFKGEIDFNWRDVQTSKIKIMNNEEPINLCRTCHVKDNKPSVS